ncbi:hypothetical protein EMMF5_003699 [Cystobasidiomycetes sp. EMM_F5]
MKSFTVSAIAAVLAFTSHAMAATYVTYDVSQYDENSNGFQLATGASQIVDTADETAAASASLLACNTRCTAFDACYATLFTTDNCILLEYDNGPDAISAVQSFSSASFRYDTPTGPSCHIATDEFTQAGDVYGTCGCGSSETQNTASGCEALVLAASQPPARRRNRMVAGRRAQPSY